MAKKDNLVHEAEGRLVANERILVLRSADGETRSYVQVLEGDRVPEGLEDAERVRYSEVYPQE